MYGSKFMADFPNQEQRKYSLVSNKGIGWKKSIGRQNFQKLIIGEGGTISNNRVGWQTQTLLV